MGVDNGRCLRCLECSPDRQFDFGKFIGIRKGVKVLCDGEHSVGTGTEASVYKAEIARGCLKFLPRLIGVAEYYQSKSV